MLAIAAALAQLGERQTEDLKAPCSIHGGGMVFLLVNYFFNVKNGHFIHEFDFSGKFKMSFINRK